MGEVQLNVCMFSNLFSPVVSGSSVQSGLLSRELIRRGHRVSVVTAHVHPGELAAGFIPVVPTPPVPPFPPATPSLISTKVIVE